MPRLFFALWPDNVVRDELYRVAQAIQPVSGGRLMRRGNLHQTLVFIGTTAAERVAGIEAAAAGIAAASFNLGFGITGYWRHNRIVWAAPVAAPAQLNELVAALEAALTRAGIDHDSRPYKAHVTLLRDARAPAALPLPPLQFQWPVRDFVLVESGHDGSGVLYRVVARWPLAA